MLAVNFVEVAPKLSYANREALNLATRCGCYFCLTTFSPAEVVDWADDREGFTALCPHCSIDAVLPETLEMALTPELLEAMHTRWFTGKSTS